MSEGSYVAPEAFKDAELCTSTRKITTTDHILSKEAKLLCESYKGINTPISFAVTFLIAFNTTFNQITIFKDFSIDDSYYKALITILFFLSCWHIFKGLKSRRRIEDVGDYFVRQIRNYNIMDENE